MTAMFPGGGGPETLLGVVRAAEPVRQPPSTLIPVEQRETLARTAAEILRDAGAQTGAGEIIVLAAWLGGMD